MPLTNAATAAYLACSSPSPAAEQTRGVLVEHHIFVNVMVDQRSRRSLRQWHPNLLTQHHQGQGKRDHALGELTLWVSCLQSSRLAGEAPLLAATEERDYHL
jgi:hypothetical protein